MSNRFFIQMRALLRSGKIIFFTTGLIYLSIRLCAAFNITPEGMNQYETYRMMVDIAIIMALVYAYYLKTLEPQAKIDHFNELHRLWNIEQINAAKAGEEMTEFEDWLYSKYRINYEDIEPPLPKHIKQK